MGVCEDDVIQGEVEADWEPLHGDVTSRNAALTGTMAASEATEMVYGNVTYNYIFLNSCFQH